MKTITHLILRRVASGKIKLTPRLLQVLKELEQDQFVRAPNNVNAPARLPDRCHRAVPTDEKRLTIVSPLPGRWIRRTGCMVGLTFLLIAGLAHAASDSSAMDAANNAFSQGHYSEAAQGYEAILAQQGYSAPVLFNLANARQREGQLGRAILNYERAALLSPNDPDIAANLRAARQKAGAEPEHPSPIQIAAHTLTMNTWFGLASVALFLFAVSRPLKLLRPQARRSLNVVSVLAALALAVAVGALELRSPDLRRAVVVTPDAVAGVSPVTMAAPVFKLRAGEIVTFQQTHRNFVLVRNHAGREGWVKMDEVALVMPPATLHKG